MVTADRVTWEFPPLPTWAEALLGESASWPEAEVRRALGMPPADTDATLAAVDAAVEGRCAGCATPLDLDGPSAYWCSPACQDAWNRQQIGRPSPGSAPVRGSEEVAVGPMRWRPDLVSAFDDTHLELLEEMRPSGGGQLTRRWYRHADGRRFLRVDDGHRWVGAYADLGDGPQVELWRRLERELSDRRRLDAGTAEEADLPPDGQRMEYHICRWEPLMDSLRPHRCMLRWSDGEWCDQTTTDPDGEVRRAERLVGPPATGGAS